MDKRVRAIYSTLANNMIRLRGRKTQKELAVQAGVSRSTIYNMERGIGCSLANLILVAAALHITPSELLQTRPEMSVTDLVRMVVREQLQKK